MNLRETREAQLAHLHQDLPPVSPIAAGDLSNADTEMVSDPLKSDPSVSSLETLNTDAKNFVKFAGKQISNCTLTSLHFHYIFFLH